MHKHPTDLPLFFGDRHSILCAKLDRWKPVAWVLKVEWDPKQNACSLRDTGALEDRVDLGNVVMRLSVVLLEAQDLDVHEVRDRGRVVGVLN